MTIVIAMSRDHADGPRVIANVVAQYASCSGVRYTSTNSESALGPVNGPRLQQLRWKQPCQHSRRSGS